MSFASDAIPLPLTVVVHVYLPESDRFTMFNVYVFEVSVIGVPSFAHENVGDWFESSLQVKVTDSPSNASTGN